AASSADRVAVEGVDRRRSLQYAAGVAAMIGIANNAIAQPSTSIAQARSAATPTDSRLPVGTWCVSWQQSLNFSKTYSVDNTAAQADDSGPGTRERPYRTINKA